MKRQLPAIVLFSAIGIVQFFTSCNGAEQPANAIVQPATPAAETVAEDTVITQLRPVLFNLQNQELSFNGTKPFDLTISNIRYTLISYKEYYKAQQLDLQEQAKFSTNKEKTQKALDYLTEMITASPATAEIYKVQFHLKAQVDKTNYNTEKILYLKKDLSPLQLIFPQ